MTKFSMIVCDHCDARDTVGGPVVPVHEIKSRPINLAGRITEPDLCEKCFDDLSETVFRLTTQQPKISRMEN